MEPGDDNQPVAAPGNVDAVWVIGGYVDRVGMPVQHRQTPLRMC
ncbi:MAG: hypothetical protein ACREQ5_20940 [Candidatus Dormibacteria bacterium]